MASVDPQALLAIAHLQRSAKPDLLTRIVSLFQSETPTAIASLHSALESGDLPTERFAAHSLKSTSACLGAQAWSDQCRDPERAARDGNFPACVALADSLEDSYEQVAEALDDYMTHCA